MAIVSGIFLRFLSDNIYSEEVQSAPLFCPVISFILCQSITGYSGLNAISELQIIFYYSHSS